MKREGLLVTLGLVALYAAALTVGDNAVLLTRPLWLDEVFTVLVAARATPIQVISDVMHGSDHAPPLLHLVGWTMRVAAGRLTPVMLRAMSLVAVVGAVVLVFLTLRRRASLLSSVAGGLAVAGNGLVVAHAFEGRFYGPWVLFAAGVAWSLGLDADRPRSRRRDVAVAIFSVLLCTIHWFGVLSLGVIAAGVFAVTPGSRRERVRLVAPAAAGVVALLLCAPMVFAQRSALTTATWIPAPNAAQAMDMARTFYLSLVPIVAVTGLLVVLWRSNIWTPLRPDPGYAALLSLGLMPVVIALVSVLVQPAMLTRYAIAGALAWGPLVAWAAETGKSPLRVAAGCGLLGVLFVNVAAQVREKSEFARTVSLDVRTFDEARAVGVPIVFQGRQVMYPVAAIKPAMRDRMALIAISDSTLDVMWPGPGDAAWPARFFRFERDVARLHERLYGFPRLVSQAQLDTTPRFLLLGSYKSRPRGYKDVVEFGRAVFPHHAPMRLRENLTLFQRTR